MSDHESASIYLDCVGDDGRSGFIARLQVDHVAEEAWLWLHAFRGGDAVAFNVEGLPFVADAQLPKPFETGTYEIVGEPAARFVRTGDASAPTGATVEVTCLAHAGATAPAGSGSLRVQLVAQFEPGDAQGSNLPGRTETLGAATGTLRIDDEEWTIRGLSQFHEQHQTTPRFTVPFTYGSLRGHGCGLVFVKAPGGSGGFLAREGKTERVSGITIEDVGPSRRLTLSREAGGEVSLVLERTLHYLLPIRGTDRESSVVIARSSDLPQMTGCVNDWDPR